LSREILYQFTGFEVVREFSLDRTDDQLRLSFTFKGREGEAQLLFVNAFPVDDIYSILDADEVWIFDDEDFQDVGRIKIEYWVDGLHQFTADNVFDLEEAEYEFEHDDDVRYKTGPIDADVVKNKRPARDENLSDDDVRFRTGPIDTSKYQKR